MTLVDPHARKVAVVTGVGPGIGRSTALALAREGCDVVVAARSADYLDEVVGELEELGAHGLAVATDTGDVAQCRALVERAVEEFDRLDVVVSSAAKGAPNHRIMNADLDDWQQAWLVNVLGPLELFRAAVPHLAVAAAERGHGGAIVAVSALAVRAINPGQGAYAATKAALTVAAQTLAREVGVDGIRVNVVVPGFVPGPNTETMFARMAERQHTTVEAVQEQMAREHTLRRLPTPDDIADAIVFLASERARSITGQTLDVNGGRWFRVSGSDERIFYSSSVHDDREIDAVVEVLRSGPQGLWPGRRVVRMEREVAARFGKAHGVMCNSGSSALYLALELLGLPPGAEVVTCALTFSTDVAPIVRGGWVPVFVDCEPLTYCVDVDRIEEMISDRTGALLFPNLIGNAPDWDRIADLAARHDLPVIEDSCDTLGATLRGTPTGARSTISVTSFANSHVITAAGNGGMVMVDDDGWRDRAVMLRRWGRRSEVNFFGSKRRERDFWEDLDGIHYDNQFIFDEVAWNFEPSELGAAFGLVQLEKLADNLSLRRRHFTRYTEWFDRHLDRFALPKQLADLETAWLGYPLMIQPDAGFERADLQEFLDGRGIDTRTIWTGNVTRQPMLGGVEVRVPDDGLPRADAVMEHGVLMPLSHAFADDTLDVITTTVDEFLAAH